MKGDFSRNTYRPASQYSRVMMQQGRVQVDADWNEQTSILLGLMRTLTRDLFGDHAGPEADCGFRIVTANSFGSLSAEEKKTVEPQLKAILERNKQGVDNDEPLILPGRYYVGGLAVDAGEGLSYSEQSGVAPLESIKGKAFLAYLDVWEEFVSADQDHHIRDVALGGVDTCGRARVMWQVRLLPVSQTKDDPLASLPSRTPGLVRITANPDETGDMLCSIAPDARYRGIENQLYRIEIQSGTGPDGKLAASFKWSRDNGSVAFPVVKSDGPLVTLAHLGRDEATGLAVGDWVELIDDAMIAATGVGQMAQIVEADPHEFLVKLALPEGASALTSYDETDATARHALLRRWDQKGATLGKSGGAVRVETGKKIELEDGIMAEFKGADYQPCDYWFIPARVLTGDVEWEGDADADGFRLPDGPQHYYAPLALVSGGKVADKRCRIARLPCIEAARDTRGATAPKDKVIVEGDRDKVSAAEPAKADDKVDLEKATTGRTVATAAKGKDG